MPAIGQQHSIESSRQLQRNLYLAAKKDKKRRFHALYDRIYRPDILWRAWEEVRKNRGSEGVDGKSLEDIERYGVENFISEIHDELKAGIYRPQPALRVYIPKPDGRKRPLGIPTIKDRVIQQACKIVIEPIFEANFLESSYGFRPKRSAAQAIARVRKSLYKGWYVIDADIQGYFDNIDHDILISLVKRRISDRRVIKLLTQWLKAGIIEEKQYVKTEVGSPQGGVISPLLANIYLHVLDAYWSQHSETGELVRHADDVVIVCKSKKDAQKGYEILKNIMSKLKLTLHPVKTKIIHMQQEGFDFLGFHFYKMKSIKRGWLMPYFRPSQKAMNSIRDAIRRVTNRNLLCVPMEEKIKELNPIIRGWRNYFCIGNSTKQFQKLDEYLWMRLWRSTYNPKKEKKNRSYKIEWVRDLFQSGKIERFYKKGICVHI